MTGLKESIYQSQWQSTMITHANLLTSLKYHVVLYRSRFFCCKWQKPTLNSLSKKRSFIMREHRDVSRKSKAAEPLKDLEQGAGRHCPSISLWCPIVLISVSLASLLHSFPSPFLHRPASASSGSTQAGIILYCGSSNPRFMSLHSSKQNILDGISGSKLQIHGRESD